MRTRAILPAVALLLFAAAAAPEGAAARVPAATSEARARTAVREREARLGQALSGREEREWHEDPERHERAWRAMLGGEDYLRALEDTGMAAFLEHPQAAESASSWTRTGPVGGFGAWGNTGRVAGLELVTTGGTDWVYAGACGGGLWRSDLANLGVWQSLGDGLPNPSVRAFAVDPANPQHILVGTGDWLRYKGSGMYVTQNAGASWSQVPLSPTPQHFFRLEYSLDGQVLVAASDNGLWRSTTGGASWTRVQSGFWSDLVLDPLSAATLYAVRVGSGVYRSVDKGATWTLLSSPTLPPTSSWGRSVLAICRDFPATLALAVEWNGVVAGVYRTVNGGATWSDVTSDLGTFGSGQAKHALALAFRPNDPNEIFLGTDTIARSYWDSGAGKLRWKVGETAAGFQTGHADMTQLVFAAQTGDDLLWIPNDGGLYYADLITGQTFDADGNSSTGLAISQVDHLDADRDMVAIGLQDNGVLRSVDAASTWTRISVADGGDVEITDPLHLDLWYWAGMPWYPMRAIWGQTPDPVPDPGLAQNFHHDPIAHRVWGGGGKSLYSAAADATPISWTTEISSGLHPASDYVVHALWGSDIETGTLFVGFAYDYDGDVTAVHKQGSSWVVHTTTGLAPTGWVWSVTPSTEWPGEAWAALHADPGQPKVYHTTDYGVTWTDVSGSLASTGTTFVVAQQPFDPLVLYAATDLGVFRSTDGAKSWQPFQTGLPVVEVRDLWFVADDSHTGTHRLRVGTYGRGTWERDVVAPPIVYVDRDWTGSEDGSFQRPWNTIAEAVAAAPAGAIVALRGNTYFEPQTITKNLVLMTYKSASVIR